MNKKQIVASLNKIANELDNTGLFIEANTLTKVMVKLAQSEEAPNTFEEIRKYKYPQTRLDKLQKGISQLRLESRGVADRFSRALQYKWQNELDDSDNIIDEKFEWILTSMKRHGVGIASEKLSPEELEIVKQEADRIKQIIADYVNMNKNQPSINTETPIQPQITPTYTPQAKEPIKEEEIRQVMAESQQKADDNPRDEKSKLMVTVCMKLLNPEEYKLTPMGLQIVEEKFRRRNPYWDPRD